MQMPIEPMATDFPFARSLLAVRTDRTILSTDQTSHEIRYYLSSLEPQERTPQQLLALIRGHWAAVEIRNHWTRDHCFGEDRCRSKNANLAAALALIRSSLLVLTETQSCSTTELIERCAHNPNIASQLIHAAL